MILLRSIIKDNPPVLGDASSPVRNGRAGCVWRGHKRENLIQKTRIIIEILAYLIFL
jgi:hypothetical protein